MAGYDVMNMGFGYFLVKFDLPKDRGKGNLWWAMDVTGPLPCYKGVVSIFQLL